MNLTRTRGQKWTFAILALVAGLATTIVINSGGSLEGARKRLQIADAGAGGFGVADGYVGKTSLDVGADVPALEKMDPELLEAVRAAAEAAAADGVHLRVTSGWRSARYQQHLLDQAVDEYGSYQEARRWVGTPENSRHVTGDAVDIGPTDAADWTSRFGDEFGLCQVFANEMWHFELLTEPGGRCPPMRSDGAS